MWSVGHICCNAEDTHNLEDEWTYVDLCGDTSCSVLRPPALVPCYWADATAQVQAEVQSDVYDVAPTMVPRGWHSFEAILTGECGDILGLSLDFWCAGLQVIGITREGGIARYNSLAPVNQQIMVHDFITRVNAVTDVKQMFLQLLKATDVELRVVRPSHRSVRIEKCGASLGLNVHYQETVSTCLKVESIAECGAVQLHNQVCEEDAQLRPQDFIERVNLVSRFAAAMLEELKHADVVELSVLRMPSLGEAPSKGEVAASSCATESTATGAATA